MYACSEHKQVPALRSAFNFPLTLSLDDVGLAVSLNYAKVITAWREAPTMAHQMVHGEGLGHKRQNRWEVPLKELEKLQKFVSDEFSMHQWVKQNPCTRLAPRPEKEAQGRPRLGRTHDPCTYSGGKDERNDR